MSAGIAVAWFSAKQDIGTWPRDRFESNLSATLEDFGIDEVALLQEVRAEMREKGL